jgi:hypothetical protein
MQLKEVAPNFSVDTPIARQDWLIEHTRSDFLQQEFSLYSKSCTAVDANLGKLHAKVGRAYARLHCGIMLGEQVLEHSFHRHCLQHARLGFATLAALQLLDRQHKVVEPAIWIALWKGIPCQLLQRVYKLRRVPFFLNFSVFVRGIAPTRFVTNRGNAWSTAQRH